MDCIIFPQEDGRRDCGAEAASWSWGHCLRREGDCPGAGVGKVCFRLGTGRGLMADYMKHLYLQHNYMSRRSGRR